MKKIALAALLASAFTGSHAAVITFDDLGPAPIANGYAGLNWSSFDVEDGLANLLSGYHNGVISPVNVAFNDAANPATISARSAAGFGLDSGYFTAAWNDGLSIRADATFENGNTASVTFVVDESGPVHEVFGWQDLSSVTFTSYGGTLVLGLAGSGTHFALDNLAVTTAVPEPADLALLAAGLGLVGVAARRRKA